VFAALMISQPHEADRNDNPRRAQNARLLEELIASHGALLRRQAARHSKLATDTEDALHDAYALFLERYHGRLPALPYLLTTIKHSAWALGRGPTRRHERSAQGMLGPDSDLDPMERFSEDGPGPEALAERHAETERWRAAMLALKPDERRALLLLGAGLSYREIGELNEWTYTKVNRCVAEGRAALRSRLAD
jgi:RNA polymerase sigma factor (sigma-70 family)